MLAASARLAPAVIQKRRAFESNRTPPAADGPTILVFDATGRSVVVDAEIGMRVVTVIP